MLFRSKPAPTPDLREIAAQLRDIAAALETYHRAAKPLLSVMRALQAGTLNGK